MGGSAGAPIRYEFTGRGRNTISPWTNGTYTYSILQLNLGSNPISKLEVASALNTVNIGIYMFGYDTSTYTRKFNLKVYIGTPQTLGRGWNIDTQSGIKFPSIWPEKGTQKGCHNYKV